MIADTNTCPHRFRVNLGLCGLAMAITLAGCAGLPDQRLANEALKRGDTALAERTYKALADLGYSDAQVGLADIKVASRDPAQIKEAEATYRAAAASSSRAQARLGRLLVAKPDSTQAEREEAETLLKLAARQGEGNTLIPLAMLYLSYPQSFSKVNAQQQIDQWRATGNPEAGLAQVLLYRTQGSYDQHLDDVEKICKAALSATDMCYVELATVYQKRGQTDQQAALLGQLQAAYARGAVPASRVDSVARVLADRSLGQTDEKTAKDLLEQVAPANPASWVSLAQLLYEFPELGDTDQLLAYIDKGREAEQPRAELLLGRLYYEGKTVPADAKKAERHLQAAADAGETSAHYYLGQLYRRGYLGNVEPQKAVDNLLAAARGGQISADYALAQLFSEGHGIRPQPGNAWVFAQLAQANPTPQAAEMLQRLEPQLTPDQRHQAEQLLAQEKQARGSMSQGANSTLATEALQDDEPEVDGEDSL
ncbi:alginate biosynthesis TPR repeat lipoprotein AlgK [Pseudomonas juntendi]|uniref:alginate biosynthesis TPR repeat lipoprotein AlgK n=1 Tax=Pseudomonas juntendi TaxID=2666183 RepID=UPI0007D7FBEE|nr:alginate biosynthesis TPR repeat lipoprotein AlgK [Pseudomonas juntendi]NOY04918.1 sel1 repeat family protein [Gammaproteobacteria bacterium]OAK58301.1 alginate biosynthesis protein [Pseudomonas putida]PPB13545.1 sel1 repeat family protein [Pseudomonas aeruginosa]MCL8331033.1 alginate biosynthesis TPR repeat lipoprotein AlgK [Pseudomonas juntendi]NPA21025.1 sel1 repeat family protein [Gammaproteobacteria bacterium]